MQRPTKILLVLATITGLCISGAALAGQGKGKGKRFEKMATALELTDEQRAAVKATRQAGKEARKALREELRDAKGTLQDLLAAERPDETSVMQQVEEIGRIKTELRKLRITHMLSLRAQLSPEQLERFRAFKAEHKGKWAKRAKRRGKRGKRGDF